MDKAQTKVGRGCCVKEMEVLATLDQIHMPLTVMKNITKDMAQKRTNAPRLSNMLKLSHNVAKIK
jgi:hypothetical protein